MEHATKKAYEEAKAEMSFAAWINSLEGYQPRV
jgi:hypothetical protein